MDGPHIRFSVDEVRKGVQEPDLLEESVLRELYRLSKRKRFPFAALYPFLADVVKKVRDEVGRFDASLPYPPSGHTELSIQFILPDKEVKVGVCSWSQKVVV